VVGAGMAPAGRHHTMNLVSVRIITDDVARLADFYSAVTSSPAVILDENFAEVRTPFGTLAIGSTATVGLFGPGSARPAANASIIVEFLVDDVDAEYERLRPLLTEVVTEPTTMPWGNRSLLVRDPDGTLVNLFTPVTADAVEKFAATPR
jgi:predicted enzyme related to lactoylglutathione lyase